MTRSDDGWPAIPHDDTPPELPPGSHVGEYIILSKIGSGGMGVVYAAYDPKLDRKIALKVLRTTFDDAIEVARARLIREGRALARVAHPNVVAVHDVGRVGDEVYVAMELVDGSTLKAWRRERPRSVQDVTAVFTEVAAGLVAIHDAGLVHRDIKPDNVLIDAAGRARVTDFGLARPGETQTVVNALADPVTPTPGAGLRTDLTQTGARLGTPAYMASELLAGGAATPQSDQFAFCVAFWECLFGQRPFEGDTWVSLTLAVNRGEIREPPRRPDTGPVPTWLRRIVERGLAPRPKDRWPSMRELQAAILAGDPHRARRRLLVGLGLAGSVGLVATGLSWIDAARRAKAVAACHEVAATIHETWNADAASTVEAAFLASGNADAAGTLADVRAALDRYTTDWETARAEVCLAGTVERTTDPDVTARAVDCLQQHRSGFEALVQVFREADDVIVARAKRSVEGLANIAHCTDHRRLLHQPPLPEDAEQRAEVQRIHEELARTLIHEHTGRYDEGLERSRTGLERALAIGHLPVVALARYRVAVFLEKRGEYADAVDAWVGSFHDAVLAGHEQLAAEASTALAFCEGYQLQRYDAGIRWAEIAGVFIERLGLTETLTEATRLDVSAVLLEMKGDYAASIATHERALDLRRRLVGDAHHSVGYGLVNLAGVLEASGQPDRARALLVEARAIFEKAFGPDNPTTAHVLHNLANVQTRLGEYDEAETLLQRVLEIWIGSLGARHPDVGDVYNAIADLRIDQGRWEDGLPLHEEALTIHSAALPDDHPTVAHTATKLGRTLLRLGRLDEAERRFQLALSTLRNAGPEQRDRVGRALHGLGSVALARGEPARAHRHFEASIAAFEQHPDDHPAWIARAKIGTAAALVLQHRPAEARELLTALITDEDLPTDVRAEAHAWQARATHPRSTDHATEARRLAALGPPGLRREIDDILGS